MRIYADCYELMSEIFREVWEMGHIVHPNSMQNKVVKDDENYITKEITNYSYCLTKLHKIEYLFLAEPDARTWADAEFKERVDPYYENPGEAWKLRRHIWEEFINMGGRFDYAYNTRMAVSLNKVIHELKRNPDSRQAIISVWNPELDIDGIGGSYRVPCSVYYQILIRDNRCNIVYNQRSADVVVHFGNDVYLAFRLMQYIAEKVGFRPGHLYHNIGSLHSYKKDWPTLKQCIEDIKIK